MSGSNCGSGATVAVLFEEGKGAASVVVFLFSSDSGGVSDVLLAGNLGILTRWGRRYLRHGGYGWDGLARRGEGNGGEEGDL